MNLKQRVVGALALTMIAIILLPILLDGLPQERARRPIDMPAAPSFEVERIDMAKFRQGMAQKEKQSRERLPVELDVELDNEASPVFSANLDQGAGKSALENQYGLDANQLPVSWTLRLGSFRNEINAINLRQSLRAKDHIAYILKSADDQGPLYRVFVGPMLNKQKLLAIATKIESEFNVQSQLVLYRSSDDVNLLGG